MHGAGSGMPGRALHGCGMLAAMVDTLARIAESAARPARQSAPARLAAARQLSSAGPSPCAPPPTSLSRVQPPRKAKTAAATLDKYGPDLLSWLDAAETLGLDGNRKLRDLAAGKHSASTMPAVAALQLHTLHTRVGGAQHAAKNLAASDVVTPLSVTSIPHAHGV
ncbi:hypothetical protein PSPO01_14839 [Paraphaeosphaeria sporulosa]